MRGKKKVAEKRRERRGNERRMGSRRIGTEWVGIERERGMESGREEVRGEGGKERRWR